MNLTASRNVLMDRVGHIWRELRPACRFSEVLGALLIGGLLVGAGTFAYLRIHNRTAAQQIGRAPTELSQQYYRFDSAEQHGIMVAVLARGLPRPSAMEFLPNGDLLMAGRGGDLFLFANIIGSDSRIGPALVAKMAIEQPDQVSRAIGLHDIAIDPQFATNKLVYWTWNEPVETPGESEAAIPRARLIVMRGRLEKGRLVERTQLLEAATAQGAFGSRLALDQDGNLWIATASPYGEAAQDPASIYGKTLRIRTDGSIPEDNPFVGKKDAHPAVFSIGHRNQGGIATHPQSGEMLTVEHGPNGGDELNLIRRGADYGWPDYTFGRQYSGNPFNVPMQGEGITDPQILWQPSIAPSGMLFYTGDAFPAWRGNLLVGSARYGQIDLTGGIERVVFNDSFGELRREALLQQLHHRVRDVAQGPDGLIYVLTDGPENAVLRIAPSE